MLKTRPKHQNKWLKLAFLVVIWLAIWSLAKDLAKVRKGFERVEEARVRLGKAQEKNRDLKQKMAAVETDYFKEKVIRDKLNMQLPGEIVVVLPEEIKAFNDIDEGVEQKEKSNWEKWWRVIK